MLTSWFALTGIGMGVVIVAGAGLFALSRVLPPGRGRELVGFGPNCAVLLTRLRADRRLPVRGRLALGAALVYVVSPVQVLPNAIPVVGQVDDLLVVTLALRYVCRRLPRSDVYAAWPGDPASLDRLLGAADKSREATRWSMPMRPRPVPVGTDRRDLTG